MKTVVPLLPDLSPKLLSLNKQFRAVINRGREWSLEHLICYREYLSSVATIANSFQELLLWNSFPIHLGTRLEKEANKSGKQNPCGQSLASLWNLSFPFLNICLLPILLHNIFYVWKYGIPVGFPICLLGQKSYMPNSSQHTQTFPHFRSLIYCKLQTFFVLYYNNPGYSWSTVAISITNPTLKCVWGGGLRLFKPRREKISNKIMFAKISPHYLTKNIKGQAQVFTSFFL